MKNIILTLLILIVGAGCCPQQQPTDSYLILYAFDEEGTTIGTMIENKTVDTLLGREVYLGTLEGKNIVLAESGIGMNNAAMTTQKMIDSYHIKGVVFTGIAGGIDSLVQIGDITVCDRWIQHDYGYYGKNGFSKSGIKIYNPKENKIKGEALFKVDPDFFKIANMIDASQLGLNLIGERLPKLITTGNGASGNQFIDSKEKRQWLIDELNARVVDMESSAVAQVCTVNDLPFIVFRSASDLAGGSGSETADAQMEEFFQVAADNSALVVREFFKKLP